jgi:hypothetical protein
MNCQNGPQLGPQGIQEEVSKRLEKYKGRNLLEQFALFMGTAQILELALKRLLARRYGYELEKMDFWTLGRTITELEKVSVRADFIGLLKSALKHRNHMAHEFLANEAMLKSILGESGRLEARELEKGIYELEQVIFLHDWCEERDAWS